MKIKIVLAVAMFLIIGIIGVVMMVSIFKKNDEKNYIGHWKDDKNDVEFKVTKASDGYYEIFVVGDDDPDKLDYFGKYDEKKKVLIVCEAYKSKDELFKKNGELGDEESLYECWVYDEKKDQIILYYHKPDYDKGVLNGTLDLQKKVYLTRVEGK